MSGREVRPGFIYDEYKKLHSLQSLERTTHRTKTANITKDDATSATHRQKVTVLQSNIIFCDVCCFSSASRPYKAL